MPRTRRSPLVTKSRVLEVLSFDSLTGVFTWKHRESLSRIGKAAGVVDAGGYVKIKIDRTAYPAHYLVWLVTKGIYPERTIQHLNGNRADNRPENLVMQQDFRDGLSQSALIEMLSYDSETGIFRWNIRRGRFAKPGDIAGHLDQGSGGYIIIGVNGETYRAHRLAWFYVFGEWPDAEIDHINGIRHDNRLVNLRVVDDLRQAWNVGIRKGNTTGKTGVSLAPNGKKYVAYLQIRHRQFYLGRYDSFEDAVEARKAAEAKYFAEYARAA